LALYIESIKLDTNMENYELERRFRLKYSIFDPSLRAKLLGIIPPNVDHTTHSIGHIKHVISFLYSIAIGKDVIFFCLPLILDDLQPNTN